MDQSGKSGQDIWTETKVESGPTLEDTQAFPVEIPSSLAMPLPPKNPG